MKLRIHGNSLRLRLSRSDVEQLRETGMCTETLRFGSGSELTYTLGTSSQVTEIRAEYGQDCIRVLLPLDVAKEWMRSEQVSCSVDPAGGNGPSILIEKDFQCLHRVETMPNDEADSFPNPVEAE